MLRLLCVRLEKFILKLMEVYLIFMKKTLNFYYKFLIIILIDKIQLMNVDFIIKFMKMINLIKNLLMRQINYLLQIYKLHKKSPIILLISINNF